MGVVDTITLVLKYEARELLLLVLQGVAGLVVTIVCWVVRDFNKSLNANTVATTALAALVTNLRIEVVRDYLSKVEYYQSAQHERRSEPRPPAPQLKSWDRGV